MKTALSLGLTPALLLVVFAICLAIAPTRPPVLGHIADRFENVNWATLPALETIATRDGSPLAYRRYGEGENVILALHGSGGAGNALHPLADALAKTGTTVIVPDIRGHGSTGRRGDVDYSGQVMDDLDDLLGAVAPEARATLIGFSMGGGLALKYAAARPDTTGEVFLLSPYLAYDAAPVTVDNPFAPETVWASPSVPRLATLGMLNGVGITALNHLEVVALATSEADADRVVRAYTFRGLRAVNPIDWQADLIAIADRATLLVGEEDELHAAHGFASALSATPDVALITLPAVDHMGLTLEADAIARVAAVVSDRTGERK